MKIKELHKQLKELRDEYGELSLLMECYMFLPEDDIQLQNKKNEVEQKMNRIEYELRCAIGLNRRTLT